MWQQAEDTCAIRTLCINHFSRISSVPVGENPRMRLAMKIVLVPRAQAHTGGPGFVCDLRFGMFKTMYENASRIALNTAYVK